ncbi:carboxypeptidase regulatory-like domain-containing protein, partial [Pseudoxanthomonas sp. SGD-10]
MLKSILGVTFLFIYFTSASVAQDPYIVKGVVTDTTSKVYLQNAVVTILNAKDSILVNFIRADHNGLFNCPISKPGMFILRVSYPGYVNYVEHFTLTTERKSINFGQLNLRLKSKLLKEIIVKGEIAAIKIKGDTTEFNAGSYLIKPNSKVEDLLKQLPGLQIDQNGNISANGESVKKVLVDGEEFFGDDPTLVTRNIRGDMVDKIQLYDKKSDQASFTGIDDGKTEKTINVKLKEDKKNGRFGKLKGGTGNDEYHELQAMANFFKHDQKFAFYAISGNNGKIGLSWQDNAKFGPPNLTEQGGMVLSDGVDGFDSTNGIYSGQGIPTAYSTGAHYNSKWKEGKESLNVNYKGGYYEIEGKKDRLTQSTLPNGLISNNSNQLFSSSAIRQKLDATYEVKPNPSLAFKFSINGTLQHSKGDNIFNMVSRREDADLLNSGNRRLSGKKHETIIGSN